MDDILIYRVGDIWGSFFNCGDTQFNIHGALVIHDYMIHNRHSVLLRLTLEEIVCNKERDDSFMKGVIAEKHLEDAQRGLFQARLRGSLKILSKLSGGKYSFRIRYIDDYKTFFLRFYTYDVIKRAFAFMKSKLRKHIRKDSLTIRIYKYHLSFLQKKIASLLDTVSRSIQKEGKLFPKLTLLIIPFCLLLFYD
jgi:hypothetical protein